MALTWEDVVDKHFQPTKFREGYAQDEVDDFLDAVALELKRLATENEDLREQLAACEAGATGEARPADAAPATSAMPLVEAPAPAPTPAVPAAQAPDASTSAAGVLAMAQRLHDEYVAEGEQRRAELISEAEAQAAALVREAEEAQSRTMSELSAEKTSLEAEVERLRGFETDYRSRLTAYLEGQLQEIRTQPRVEPRGTTA